ncbi:hypothetical protein WJX84_003965 [Apatococcus fuscideae]|uniref:Uncharacterized protein n=1 Tax=Apatococcus fuscideae TaxID=2026836 RepID=A0AAW1SCJ2_9CHLO
MARAPGNAAGRGTSAAATLLSLTPKGIALKLVRTSHAPGAHQRSCLPLREIDLYNFQGLLKHEGKARYGEQYRTWQTKAASFEIEGHAPVRGCSSMLIVAHNAVNQAMVAAALGLPPTYFRRMLQSNQQRPSLICSRMGQARRQLPSTGSTRQAFALN